MLDHCHKDISTTEANPAKTARKIKIIIIPSAKDKGLLFNPRGGTKGKHINKCLTTHTGCNHRGAVKDSRDSKVHEEKKEECRK